MALAKARLVEITSFARSGQQSDAVPESQNGKQVTVHFNPQSLKVSAANNNQGGSQPGGGSGRQYVGPGSSNLQVELVFDTTAARANDQANSDVRKITEKLAYFVIAKEQRNDRSNRRAPPLARFEWGSFIFEGVVDSLDETLDYFSEEGVPLRATVALKMSRDDIAFVFGRPRAPSAATPAGVGQQPLAEARSDENLSSLAARNGQSGDWKSIAAANDIDDPLRLEAGALINLSAGAGVSATASAGLGASAGAGVGASAQAGFSAGLGGGAGFAASAGAGVSAGAGASAGFGASAGAGASIGAGAPVGASAGFGASAGAGASAGFGASAGAGASASVNSGVGVQAGVGVKFP